MAIKIFIDQGHNPSGPNTGAEGFGLKEQDITYQVGKELAELLRADDRFEVRLSRNTPEERLGTSNTTSLAARVRAANAWPADYFISIHANANTDPVEMCIRDSVRVNKYLAVNNLWQTDWTGSFNLTFLTAFAEICVWLRNTLTVDTKVVQGWLDTVVRTSAYSNLELVREC